LNSLATFVRSIFQTFALADCGNIEPIRGVIDIFEGPVGRKRIRSAPISSVASLAFASEITRSRQQEIVLSEVLFKSYLASHVLSPNSNFFLCQIRLHLQIMRLKTFGQAAWIRESKSW
jgi:hypothetical protein